MNTSESTKNKNFSLEAANPNLVLHFPEKIYIILETESPEIIRWENNGCAFRIVDHNRFEAEILPKWFRRKLK